MDVLNLKNGLLDIGTLTLKPHSPNHLSSVQIPIEYAPEATCPAIDRFVDDVFPEDAQDLAWEMLGDVLTPDRSIQKALLLVGEGGNGKGVYLTLVTNFVGKANVANVSLHRLEQDRFSVAQLYGKLANVCADLPSEHLVSTSTFKGIVGNDRMLAEFKFKDAFSFEPHARLLFSANYLPQTKDTSKGFYDRWVIVPFMRNFRGERNEIPRSELDARLADPKELSDALNKALAALKRLRERGRFTGSDSTKTAMQEFRDITDPLAIWLERETVTAPEAMVPAKILLAKYNEDSEAKGYPPMTLQYFGRAVHRLRPGLQEAQRIWGGVKQRVYLGIGLPGAEGENDVGRALAA